MTSRICCFLLALLTVAALQAQTSVRADGRQAVEHTGIALVKPQKWSKPNEAVAVRFTAYTNRGGYFVLRSPSGQERQVWVEQIVGGKPLLTPDIPSQILTPADRNKIQAEIDELKQLVAKVPSAAIDIAQLSKPLVEAVQSYDAGEVRVDGFWEPVSKYREREFYLAEKQLQQSIDREPDKSQVDLDQNPKFNKLVELAKDNPAFQAKIEAFRGNLQKQALAEHRAQLLKQLSNPITPATDTQSLLEQLRAMKNPDDQITLILQQASAAEILNQQITKFQEAVETHFAGQAPADIPPPFPGELEFQNKILAEQISNFRASAPPAAIRLSEEKARALDEMANSFPKISPLLEQRNYSQALALLNRLTTPAARIGPRTEAVIAALKTSASQKADAFSKLRAEGETAEKSGNAKDAIAKYTAAIEISPNAELSAKIEQLQKPAKKQP